MSSKIKVSQLKNLNYIQKRASQAANRNIGGYAIKPPEPTSSQDKFHTDRDKPGVPVL